MISWTTILYGAALTAAFTAAALALIVRERRTDVIVAAVAASAAGPLAWNGILRATGGEGFFTDAPIAVFPVSRQDTGSGVFAAALVGAVALAVDVYLY